MVHAVLPFSDSLDFHRLKSLRHIFFQGLEGVITVFGEVPLDSAPEELNEIEFTMELGQENAAVACCLDDFLNQGPLRFEIGLQIKNMFSAAISCLTAVLALHMQSILP